MSKKEQKGMKAALPDNETSQKPADVAATGNLTQKKRSFGTPFKPGKSGNPSGRALPHRAATVEAIKHALGVVDPKLGKTALERIIEHSIRRALQGSHKDKKLLLNYGLGMPKQTMDLEVFNYTDALAKIQERRAARAGNGHTDPQTAIVAAALPDQSESIASEDAEPIEEGRPARAPRPGMRVRVEL